MKKSIFTLFILFLAFQAISQNLPTLIDTFPAPCGGRVDWSHSSTGNPDAVGFLLLSTLSTCLPQEITFRHYAFSVKDKLDVYFQDTLGAWYFQYSTGWHRRLKEKTLSIPSWVTNVMFVSSNNLYSGTLWWFELDCIYPDLSECCELDVSISGPQDTVCPNTQVTLVAHGLEGYPPFQYFWNGSSVASDSVFNGNTRDFSTTFRVRIEDSLGCVGLTSFLVPVYFPPVVVPDTLVCLGSFVQIPVVPGVIWQAPDTIVQVFQNTTFWGTTVDSFGCEHNIPFRIYVQNKPVVSAGTTVCRGQSVMLSGQGVSFTWADLSGNFLGNDKFLEVKVTSDTALVVEITDTLGCQWIDTLSVYEEWCFDSAMVYIPNVFTPNSQDNSSFEVFINTDAQGDIRVKELRIWDRWGGLLFQSEFGTTWNGFCLDGKPAPCAVYIYEVVFRTPEGDRTLFGDVTLIR